MGQSHSNGSRFANGLWEQKHLDAMGQAIWLFGWCVSRQDRDGWVNRGEPVTYTQIAEHYGKTNRTLQDWLRVLRTAGYLEVQQDRRGVRIRVNKQAKFPELGEKNSPTLNASSGRKKTSTLTEENFHPNGRKLPPTRKNSSTLSASSPYLKDISGIEVDTRAPARPEKQPTAAQNFEDDWDEFAGLYPGPIESTEWGSLGWEQRKWLEIADRVGADVLIEGARAYRKAFEDGIERRPKKLRFWLDDKGWTARYGVEREAADDGAIEFDPTFGGKVKRG